MPASFVVENTKPGVTVIINAGQVARPVARQPTSTVFVVGAASWGPLNTPTIVTSMADYFRQFGPFNTNSYMDDALFAFFNLFPGRTAVVCRVAGEDAALATLNLLDAANPTLRVDALHPSSAVVVRVEVLAASDGVATHFNLRARSSELAGYREEFQNLDMEDAATLARVNQDSKLIRVTDLASASLNPRPVNSAEAPLLGGSDDFAGLTDAEYIGVDAGGVRTGLQAFNDENLGGGQVILPGVTTLASRAALHAHCDRYNRMGFIDPPLGSTPAQVIAIRQERGSRNLAVHWPWVRVRDFAGTNLDRFVPPSAFAAGACAWADRTIGTHQAPANVVITAALDVERHANGTPQVDDSTHELLNGRDVNVILPVPGEGVKIMGARVMTPAGDRRVQFIHQARVLNLFYYSMRLALGWVTFKVIDSSGKLFRDIRSTLEAFLRPFHAAGALYGEDEAEAYSVVCDDSNNLPEELEMGRVRVQVAVHISPTAEVVILNIDNVPLFQELSAVA